MSLTQQSLVNLPSSLKIGKLSSRLHFKFLFLYFWVQALRAMTKIFTLFFSLLLLGTAKAQAVTEPLEVKEVEFDFGTIAQGKPVYHYFQIINKGTTPIKLDNVQATCGCTTPEWGKDPIAPGATDKIKVGYNAAAEGHFEKYVTISYNGNASKQIKIKGSVWKAPAGSAPSNASVTFLKQTMQ